MVRLGVSLWLGFVLYGQAGSPESQATKLFAQGKRAEKKGDLFQAYSLYTQAAALDPARADYASRSIGLRSKAMSLAKVLPKVDPEVPAKAEVMPPDFLPFPELGVDALISPSDLEDIKRLRPPPELKASDLRLSFALNAPPRELFEKVLKAYGYDVIFDTDYPAGGPPQRFDVADQGYREAIYALETLTGSFLAPMSGTLVMVVKDTQPKRQEQERTVAVMVPIPEPFQSQEAQELARAVQQVMELQKFAIDGTRRAAYIRGPASKVKPAVALFEQLIAARAQVTMEVELYEVNKSSTWRWGVDLPSTFNLRSFTELVLQSTGGAPLSRALKLLGASNYYSIGVGSAQLIASMTHNNAATLLKSEVRTVDQMPAQLHVGDKYPVQTAGFLNSGGLGFQAPPTVQFEDLGLTLKITPRIHNMDEITMDIEAEFKLLTGQALNGIPVIANRKYTGKVRLRSGEWAVVAGLVTDSRTTSLTGIPVLSAVPGLGQRTKENRRGDTLLVIRPRVITLPPSELTPTPIWVGTEARLRNPL